MSPSDVASPVVDENVALFVDFLTSEADRVDAIVALQTWLADPVEPFVGRDYLASMLGSEVHIRRVGDDAWPTLVVEVPTLRHGIRAIADLLEPPPDASEPFSPTQSVIVDVLGDALAFRVAFALEPGFAWARVHADGREAWLPSRNVAPAITALLDPEATGIDTEPPAVPHPMFDAVRLVVANELGAEPVAVGERPDPGWRVAVARSAWRPAGRGARMTLAALCIHDATGLCWFVSDAPRPDPEEPGMPFAQAATRLLEILCFADTDQQTLPVPPTTT